MRQAVVTGIEMNDNPNDPTVGLVLRILPDDGQPPKKLPAKLPFNVSGFKPGRGPLRFSGENCDGVDISESLSIIDPLEQVIDLTKLPTGTKYLRIWRS